MSERFSLSSNGKHFSTQYHKLSEFLWNFSLFFSQKMLTNQESVDILDKPL